jgi:hypothetical protein
MRISPGKLDVVLIVPLIATLMMVGDEPARESVTWGLSPFAQAATLGVATALLALFVVKATSLDRRCSEEYIFQVMANAALVALGTMALFNLFWLIAMKFYPLPELAGTNMVGITILAWILSYYWYRFRGMAQ